MKRIGVLCLLLQTLQKIAFLRCGALGFVAGLACFCANEGVPPICVLQAHQGCKGGACCGAAGLLLLTGLCGGAVSLTGLAHSQPSDE